MNLSRRSLLGLLPGLPLLAVVLTEPERKPILVTLSMSPLDIEEIRLKVREAVEQVRKDTA